MSQRRELLTDRACAAPVVGNQGRDLAGRAHAVTPATRKTRSAGLVSGPPRVGRMLRGAAPGGQQAAPQRRLEARAVRKQLKRNP